MDTTRLTLRFLAIVFVLVALSDAAITTVDAQETSDQSGREHSLPEGARLAPELSSAGLQAYLRDQSLWLLLDPKRVQSKKAVLPRVCAPIRSFRWKNNAEAALKFVPEPQQWVFSWQAAPDKSPVIEIVFDSAIVLTQDCPPAVPAGDGSVMLHAYQARTVGEKLRFEPQWYKNTVGYWTIDTDYVIWELEIDQPGTYSVAVLQGCGKGQGGSDAEITLQQANAVKARLPFQTIDTGHFQNFRWNHVGKVEISSSGPHELRVEARRIAKNALFDVRMIHLVRQAKSLE